MRYFKTFRSAQKQLKASHRHRFQIITTFSILSRFYIYVTLNPNPNPRPGASKNPTNQEPTILPNSILEFHNIHVMCCSSTYHILCTISFWNAPTHLLPRWARRRNGFHEKTARQIMWREGVCRKYVMHLINIRHIVHACVTPKVHFRKQYNKLFLHHSERKMWKKYWSHFCMCLKMLMSCNLKL